MNLGSNPSWDSSELNCSEHVIYFPWFFTCKRRAMMPTNKGRRYSTELGICDVPSIRNRGCSTLENPSMLFSSLKTFPSAPRPLTWTTGSTWPAPCQPLLFSFHSNPHGLLSSWVAVLPIWELLPFCSQPTSIHLTGQRDFLKEVSPSSKWVITSPQL